MRLYLAHRAALVEYATPIVGDRMRAEDVVQEAYMRFAPRPDDVRVEQPAAYLYRIVRNLAYDLRRRLSADKRRDEAHLVLSETLPPAVSPEEEALQRDELRRAEAALAELPDNVRRAFEMNRIGGYTLQETADHLGVPLSTAARWAQTALMHVARRLQRPSSTQTPNR
ncbi:sigma-70 family RNA polymerase sigma factor [Reyranella sp.]|uniref:sigma-70 family RNA polymerase sigma factor n=1 Tax=Reyranella sp. TaxID=1929291 RepID=UPI0025F4FA87|nr:sigma-70 family RNA polymerase sigma factor [Reyranella sp.]